MKKIILTLCLLSTLAYDRADAQSDEINASSAVLVELLGFTSNKTGVTYRVRSGGCTSKKHFGIVQIETSPMQLQLLREVPDYCEAFIPYGTDITFTWEELGLTDGTKFIVSNQIATQRVFIRP